jgi:hypothetical protein
MKNKLSILVLLLAIAIPQVVFASWWNPLSWFDNWSFFNRANSKTQVLENRIKELEEKLGTTTPSVAENKATSSIKSEPEKTESPIFKPKPVVPKEENFSSVMFNAYNNQADTIQKLSNVVEDMISYVDIGLDSITTLRNQLRAYGQGFGQNTEIIDTLVSEYNSDVEMVNIYRRYFVNIKKSLDDGSSEFRAAAQKASTVYVSRQEAVTEITELNTTTVYKHISNDLDEEFEKYKTYRKNKDNEYKEAMAYLQGMVDSSKSSYVPRYTPQPLPTISVPTAQSTYCNVYGNSISCNSYSY